MNEAGEILVEAGFERHEEGLDDVLAKEGEDGSGHSDDAIDGLGFVGRDRVNGVFGGIDEINTKEAEAKNEETFFGEVPDFGEVWFF